jgi:arylsulfatase A-like enzyme
MRRIPHVVVLLCAAGLALFGCSKPPRPNVVLIVVDTLRKDVLHLYGDPRPDSPTLDALGKRGWVFDNHLAHASQTVPSTLSIMLSRYPAEHGFGHRSVGQWAEQRPVFPDSFLFLAEVFRDAGYATAAFVANPYLGPQSGFAQGFDTFEFFGGGEGGRAPRTISWDATSGLEISRRATEWIENHEKEGGGPFFLYLHYMDVHQPYRPPRAYLRRFPAPGPGRLLGGNGKPHQLAPGDLEFNRARYAAAVAYVDDLIGGVVGSLDADGLREDTIVAVTSDHGEEFMEHGGIGHGTTVYGELVRVPLVIVYPRSLAPGHRVTYLSQHLDLAPTLLRLAGIEPPPAFDGKSVFDPAAEVYTEDGPWWGVYAGDRKLVWNDQSGATELYDAADELDATPREDPEATRRLRALLDRYLAIEAQRKGGAPQGSAWSAEEKERLRALGYLQ